MNNKREDPIEKAALERIQEKNKDPHSASRISDRGYRHWAEMMEMDPQNELGIMRFGTFKFWKQLAACLWKYWLRAGK
jgi:hypothetical protein